MFDIDKTTKRLHILIGLIKAMDIIDEIIAMIKASASATAAKETLKTKWDFSEEQAKAILDTKLSKLAKLEKEELEAEKQELEALLIKLQEICEHPIVELRKRLSTLVAKYGDDRRTELINIEVQKEEKEIEYVEPEKCIVILTESGMIKRIPATSIVAQRKGGKGVKTQNDVTTAVIRTNTIDNLMIFTNAGKMYRLLVDNIPVGTNNTPGVPVSSLVEMAAGEKVETIYSIYRETDAKYVLFVSKNGIVKKSSLSEYTGTKKSKGIGAVNIRENDELAAVTLINEEPLVLLTKNGYCIKFNSTEISTTARMTTGVKGINLNDGDEIVAVLPLRNSNDELAIFTSKGFGKKMKQSELVMQKRGGKGVSVMKASDNIGTLAAAQFVADEDAVLLVGAKTSICIKATDIPSLSRISIGNSMIKDNNILSASKV
jgi:DNA gyrase subunit A